MDCKKIKIIIALIFTLSYSPIFCQNDFRSNASTVFDNILKVSLPANFSFFENSHRDFYGKNIKENAHYIYEANQGKQFIKIKNTSTHRFFKLIAFFFSEKIPIIKLLLKTRKNKLFINGNITHYSLRNRLLNKKASLAVIPIFAEENFSFTENTSGDKPAQKFADIISGGKPVFNTIILVLLILISILAYLNYLSYRKKISAFALLEEKNKEILAQKEEIQATLNMVEKLNSKLDAQSQALNRSAMIAILTLAGNIDFVNEKFIFQTGYKLGEIAKKSFNKLLHKDHLETFSSDVLSAVESHDLWRGELCLIKKNGNKLWVDAVFVPLTENHDAEYKIYVIQFDITQRVVAEQKLIEKNNHLKHLNQLKNKIFSIVSHDFRSPLKSLLGTLALFKKGAISPEELKNLSSNLLEKVENTSNFLENILNWSKSQMKGLQIKPEVFDIREVMQEMITLLKPQAEKKRITIKNETQENIKVLADLEMIKLVLRNLISNAMKFSYEENSIVIKTFVARNQAVIFIEDFGTGISDEQMDALFKLESYSTTGTANELGAGLGLILCKEFVEQNNGEIWVESVAGSGSVFSFSLPLAES